MTLCLTSFFLVAFPGIIPSADTFILGQILGKDIAAVQTMESTYSQVKTFTEFAKDTRENIIKMARMEQDVQNALKTAKSVRDFKFSDISYLLQKATGIDASPNVYLPGTSLTQSLLKKINSQQGNGQAGMALYTLYHQPVDLPLTGSISPVRTTVKSVQDQLGMEQFLAAQQGASYEVLINFAERFQQQALEIQSSVKKEDLFSMTTSERMQQLLNAGNLMEKSVELKLRAAEILKQQPGETIVAAGHAAEYMNIQAACSSRINASIKTTNNLF